MSHCRKDLVRDKMIGKKWIYLGSERSTRQSVGHVVWIVFIAWVISYANEWEDYPIYFGGRGGDFQELGHHSVLSL